jgi:hypothetical protein
MEPEQDPKQDPAAEPLGCDGRVDRPGPIYEKAGSDATRPFRFHKAGQNNHSSAKITISK